MKDYLELFAISFGCYFGFGLGLGLTAFAIIKIVGIF